MYETNPCTLRNRRNSIGQCDKWILLLVFAMTFSGLSMQNCLAQSQPKWIIAHKVNQPQTPIQRLPVWFDPPRHYPICWGYTSEKEESLDQYFDGPHYSHSIGLEFDIWYNEPGDDINDHGADQQDIFGNTVSVGKWYVSHEPCDDHHVPLDVYVSYLKSKLDVYGTGRCRLLLVDIKAPYNHQGNFDPISEIRDALRSGLGVHFDNMNFVYSTAFWEDRGVFAQNNFARTLYSNELIGIDESINAAHPDNIAAAHVARDWAINEIGVANVYFSDRCNPFDGDCTFAATLGELAQLMNETNYPQIVGAWTVKSSDDTSLAGNQEIVEYYNLGVNLFLMENYHEGSDGTGGYQFLHSYIQDDPNSHLASQTDRPWIPGIEPISITSDNQDIEGSGFAFAHGIVGLPVQVYSRLWDIPDAGGDFHVIWGDKTSSSGSYAASEMWAVDSYENSGVFSIDVTMNSNLWPASNSTSGIVEILELDESVGRVASGLIAAANNPAEPPEVMELLHDAAFALQGDGGALNLLEQSLRHPACQKISESVQKVDTASDLAQTSALGLAVRQLVRGGKAIAIYQLREAVENGLDAETAMVVNNIILQGTLFLNDDLDLEALGEFCRATAYLNATGDMNGDSMVNLLDVNPFVEAIGGKHYAPPADINGDGVVNLLDVAPFIDMLTGG